MEETSLFLKFNPCCYVLGYLLSCFLWLSFANVNYGMAIKILLTVYVLTFQFLIVVTEYVRINLKGSW